jgi:hypothetical protein
MMFAPPTRPSCRPTPGSPGSILIERAVEAHTRPTVVDATQRTSPWAPRVPSAPAVGTAPVT